MKIIQKYKAFHYLEQLIKFGIKLDLTNITEILQKLGNPQQHLPTIHIAGTNGKGSVSCMLNNALQKENYKIGLFTSPYLVHFCERWRINGETIDEEILASFILQISQLDLLATPTYFEVITAVAFLWFSQQKVDICILETGMGGRLDATNICNPILTVITNIEFDHIEYLGDTIEKIALEKAGIIKNKIPIILGKMNKEAQLIISKKAKKMNAPIINSTEYKLIKQQDIIEQNKWISQKITFKKQQQPIQLTISLAGNHQIENCQIVLTIIDYLANQKLLNNKQQAYKNIAKSYWAGRFDYLSANLIIDGAHNPHSIQVLVSQINKLHPQQKWHIYFASMNDKDWQSTIELLLPISASWKLPKLQITRACPPQTIVNFLKTKKQITQISEISDIKLQPKEPTLIIGSLYLVGEVLTHLKGHQPLNISNQ